MNLTLPRPRPARFAIAVGALVLASAQIAIPLTSTSPWLATVVVVSLAVVAFGCAWYSWGLPRAGALFGAVAVLAWAIELLGSRTGVPFGDYAYTDQLQPQLLGVPAIVPLAWFAMGLAAFATARAMTANRVAQCILGALALAAWDVFLDPQMVNAGFWEWRASTWWTYQGIPLVNFAGWFVAGLAVMAVCLWLAGSESSIPLVVVYTWVAVMQTIGFLVFFGNAFVGICGGLAMLPFVGVAWWRVRRG